MEIVVLCIYRSNNPRSDFDIFIYLLDRVLLKLYNSKYLVISGDFNVDLLKDSNAKSQFLSVLNMYNIKPTVLTPTSPTRVPLDNNLVNFPVQAILNSNTNFFTGLGDHKHAQVISFHVNKQNVTTKILQRTYKIPQIEKFKKALSSVDFSSVYAQNDVNDKMLRFYNIFLPLFNSHFPYKAVSVGNSKKKAVDHQRY